jgi:hypothetical protein
MIGSFGLDDIEIYVRDIQESWVIYLLAVPMIFVLLFLWNLCLRFFADTLAWVSIVLVGIMIAALGFGCLYYGANNYPQGDSTQTLLKYTAYFLWAADIVYFCVVMCSYYSIKISITVLKVSARIVMNNMRMIFVPIIGMLVTLVWIGFFVYSLVYLLSCGEMVTTSVEIPGF